MNPHVKLFIAIGIVVIYCALLGYTDDLIGAFLAIGVWKLAERWWGEGVN